MNVVNQSIIFFDGVCVLCNTSVRFILRHDTTKSLIFTTLQSDVAKDFLLQHSPVNLQKDSILFWHRYRWYDASTAALKIAQHFKWYWWFLQVFWIFPKPVRDWGYSVVAKNRYRWFGKKETCFVPTSGYNHRFLR